MSESAASLFVYSMVGFAVAVFIGAMVIALFSKADQQREDTAERRARRARIEAWTARRGGTMAMRLVGSSWGFALGVLASTLLKRRVPGKELRRLIPAPGGDADASPPTHTAASEQGQRSRGGSGD
jgi:hypothetical protein